MISLGVVLSCVIKGYKRLYVWCFFDYRGLLYVVSIKLYYPIITSYYINPRPHCFQGKPLQKGLTPSESHVLHGTMVRGTVPPYSHWTIAGATAQPSQLDAAGKSGEIRLILMMETLINQRIPKIIWVCLKMSCTPKPNGFADHYPYEKWLFHWGYTQHFQTKPFAEIPWYDTIFSWCQAETFKILTFPVRPVRRLYTGKTVRNWQNTFSCWIQGHSTIVDIVGDGLYHVTVNQDIFWDKKHSDEVLIIGRPCHIPVCNIYIYIYLFHSWIYENKINAILVFRRLKLC